MTSDAATRTSLPPKNTHTERQDMTITTLQNVINGTSVSGSSPDTIDVLNPSTAR